MLQLQIYPNILSNSIDLSGRELKMKNTYQVMYGTSILVFLIVILGGTITKPIFNSFSVRTMETAGVKKASFDSLDSRIDEMLFTVNKVQLQIEKFKNLFSEKEIDESKYQKQKNELFSRTFYAPVNEMLIYFYRIFFFSVSVFLLLIGVIVHLIFRGTELRNRVSALERRLELDGV
jgi:hypothetical protein